MLIDRNFSPAEPAGTLGDILRETKRATGMSLDDLTVMTTQTDPYRLDTKAHHRNGQWLLDQMMRANLLSGTAIHLRGIHYVLVAQGDVIRPDGSVYVNDEPCWDFLSNKAGKAARWLGYVPWDRIFDARNAEPVIFESSVPDPRPVIEYDAADWIPEAWQLKPFVGARDFRVRQPHKIVFFGEKTSLEGVLKPIAQRYDADLYLPSGDMSDTLIWRMAKNASLDGRGLPPEKWSSLK